VAKQWSLPPAGNTAPADFGADVYNQRMLQVDATCIIGILDGNPSS
jgi:hypothetical protein